ncbi:MAG: L-erythro-3,5-diaminohexanoate dehydrogenase [Thermoleophilia bacterium]|nr:L-erythro-3,5-diaminohexanoate dehydrogenase [Thermoleophilia bacterium]
MPSADSLGADRVISPPGALPQSARRIHADLPTRVHEIGIDVETLCLDSTSFRQLSDEAEGDPLRIAELISGIVQDRGKMHNPVTGSGGVLIGTVKEVGSALEDPPSIGDRIVTLASLTLTPLTLERVGPVETGSAQIPVEGTAFLMSSAPWAECPDDLDLDVALAALDVCGSPWQTRELVDRGDTVMILGAGHAGKLAMAAAREQLGNSGLLVTVDNSEMACSRAQELGLSDHVVQADLRNPLSTVEALRQAGVVGQADLTIVVVNATDCEATSILLTKNSGTVLFFSMATSFTAAALGSEGVSSRARMLIGSGYSPDRGAYALELLRSHPTLQDALSKEPKEVLE